MELVHHRVIVPGRRVQTFDHASPVDSASGPRIRQLLDARFRNSARLSRRVQCTTSTHASSSRRSTQTTPFCGWTSTSALTDDGRTDFAAPQQRPRLQDRALGTAGDALVAAHRFPDLLGPVHAAGPPQQIDEPRGGLG